MPNDSRTIQEAFAHFLAANHPEGTLAAIAMSLAEGGINDPRLRDIIPHRRGIEYSAVQSDLLDLVLLYIQYCLQDHYVTPEESSNVHLLKVLFHVREADLYSVKRTEVKKLLSAQISMILNDQNVDPTEAIHQVELQRCFGLSYDQILELTRPRVEQIVDELISQITADGAVTSTERASFVQRVLALDTVYSLSPEQKRLLDGLAP